LDFEEEGPGAMLWGLWGFLGIRVGVKKIVVKKKTPDCGLRVQEEPDE
jgi:hypothetical protein